MRQSLCVTGALARYLALLLLPLVLAAPALAGDWPLNGPVVRGYDPPLSPYGAGHRGVDLAAAKGAPVVAAADGRVSFAGKVAKRGVLSITLTGSGDPPLRTTYQPVRPLVTSGEQVRTGQPVAVLQKDAAHCGPGPDACLHWGLRRGRTYLDPLTLLGGGHSRLLPYYGVAEPTP